MARSENRCVVCHKNFPLRGEICSPCLESPEAPSRAHDEPLCSATGTSDRVLSADVASRSSSSFLVPCDKTPDAGVPGEASNDAGMPLPPVAQQMIDRVTGRATTPFDDDYVEPAGPSPLDGLEIAPLDEDAETALVEDLLRDYERGELQPEPVELPPLPPDADPAMLKVAAFYRLVRGLRLTMYAGCDDRPVLFCCRWVAGHTGINYKAVSRKLGELVRLGVLAEPIPFPLRGRPRPGFLYAPGVLIAAANRGEEVDRADAAEPDRESVHDPLVARAVVAVGDRPLNAAGHRTDNGVDGDLHPSIMPHGAVDPAPLNAIGGPL